MKVHPAMAILSSPLRFRFKDWVIEVYLRNERTNTQMIKYIEGMEAV